MWLLPVSLLGNLLYQTLYLWAIRERGFGVMARTRVTQSLARVGVQLSFGVAGVSPLGLLLGDVAGGAVGSGSFARMLRKRRPQARRLVSADAMRRCCRRYSRFAWFGTPAALLNTAGLQGIPLLVAYSYGGTVAGWYALTMRVVALPISILGMAVGETYFGIGPELARTDPAALRRLFKKAAVRLFAIGVGPTIVLVLAGPALFSFVFGDEWSASGVYATYLAPALLAQLVTSPLSSTTTILERQGLQLMADAFRVTLVLLTFLLADRLSWSADAALVALSVALLASYVVYFLMSWWLINGMDARAVDQRRSSPPTGECER
jgi:O-antigen/teichoic acid export membrane protein